MGSDALRRRMMEKARKLAKVLGMTPNTHPHIFKDSEPIIVSPYAPAPAATAQPQTAEQEFEELLRSIPASDDGKKPKPVIRITLPPNPRVTTPSQEAENQRRDEKGESVIDAHHKKRQLRKRGLRP